MPRANLLATSVLYPEVVSIDTVVPLIRLSNATNGLYASGACITTFIVPVDCTSTELITPAANLRVQNLIRCAVVVIMFAPIL